MGLLCTPHPSVRWENKTNDFHIIWVCIEPSLFVFRLAAARAKEFLHWVYHHLYTCTFITSKKLDSTMMKQEECV